MTILSTIIFLGVLIFVHELGHFLAARSVGVRVERFSIGFGPRLLGFTRGDTEYVLSAIPLGGYVKMGGMDDQMMEVIEGGAEDENASEEEVDHANDFDAKPLWARAWVISAGVIMNVIFAFVTYTVVAAGWGRDQYDTTRFGTVDLSALPASAGALGDIPPGATLVRVANRDVEHWGDVREALRNAPDGPLTIDFQDPTGEVRIDLTGPVEHERAANAVEYWLDPVIDFVNPGTPAARAGLRRGDRIVALDGQEVDLWPDVQSAVRASADQEIVLTVERDGARMDIPVTPANEELTDPVTGETSMGGQIGVLAAVPDVVFTAVSPLEAVALGWTRTTSVTAEILGFLRDLVTGRESARNVGGIVAIGEMSGQAAAQGLPMFLQFMALFSVNLAILNLLPIPVLDGGHLLFLGIEGVRGRPLSMEQRLRWSQVGFALLVGIMAFALGNDVLRLLGM
jgi:regulator of sigma E protease